ncbi:MAG TPA: MFS transporter [Micromonosporaceae bacterium]|nr:MFS transporter [Micromonosporaceae bacterium]
MPQMDTPGRSTAGRAVGGTIKGAKAAARGSSHVSGWAVRNVLFLRHRSGAGEIGMMRLLDLHAASCAGDTLVTMGLATTVFFSAPVGQARGQVALYLLITMVPFAILAPIVGPVLDRFRHGRRLALSVTMFGRALLAWAISDYLHTFGLFPAAFGVLALSRAYGVARSAAVPRLLPAGLGLSEAGARASIFGTLAGAVVAPLGVAALKIGPQWPLRVAALIFVAGGIVALRLPPRADSDAPEVPPRIFQGIFQLPGLGVRKVLSGRLILATLANSAVLRAGYGFLALFLAFSIRAHDLPTKLFGVKLSSAWALGAAVGALGLGSFLATMVGSRVRIRRPQWLQSIGTTLVAVIAIYACFRYTLGAVILLSLSLAMVSGLAKLAVDATIQERIDEGIRASAFAHSETVLMLAWVVGGGLGLIPYGGRPGLIVAAVGLTGAAMFAAVRAFSMRSEHLTGSASTASTVSQPPPTQPAPTVELAGRTGWDEATWASSRQSRPVDSWLARWRARRAARARSDVPATAHMPAPGASTTVERAPAHPSTRPPAAGPAEPGRSEPGRTKAITTRVLPREDADQPGFHLYRPGGGQSSDNQSTGGQSSGDQSAGGRRDDGGTSDDRSGDARDA